MNIILFTLWALLFVVSLFILRTLKTKFRISFSVRVFIAMIAGGLFGFLAYKTIGSGETLSNLRSYLFVFVGYGFIDLLKMIIIPLVPTSIIVSFLQINDQKLLKKIGFRTLGLFFITASVASLIGVLVASVMNLGSGMDLTAAAEPSKSSTVAELFKQFRGFIPSNPIANAAEMKLVPIIVFSLFVAVAASIEQGRDASKLKAFKEFMQSFYTVVIRITKIVLKLTPYGVFALSAFWLSNAGGIEAIPELGLFVLAIIIASLLHVTLTYGFGFTVLVNKLNPIKFFKAASPASILAFTSRSSAGTLTVTIQTIKERLKVSDRVANFVAPIGAVMNMDACGGIYPAVVAIFAANAFNIDLSITQYIIIVFVSILASLGTAGVPMGATIFTTIALSAAGLPVEAIGLVVGVDFIVDMFRTSVNVTGDMVVATTVGKSIGEFDEEAFNSATI
ncbi:dicarboxylate/amino acid:cation symporter [Haloplasma contractile]|uniref:Proton-sodiumglutamate symporter DAACS family protein n=1 Tax=Haloplasma contractile SSD-17B TaxID=1033810 RepID=U2FDW2_9MOLU|nr:dicarboxylate/amino acid:cation symporter [Haloplasma contractile]ERJ11170.1 Proton-sodiumglutamate symporter DAACS family protein [Haloplasma contractile SSD-17B]